MSSDATGRYVRLASFLEQDPTNLALLADAADAAFAEERFEEAQALLDRHAAIAPLADHHQHLAGLVAMRLLDWDGAAARFAALFDAGVVAPPVRFNLGWSLAMSKRFDEALRLLDEASSDAIPQAAQLEVQLLHELGDFDRAAERARKLVERHPDHRGLNAAVSTLAIDIEDEELAFRTAGAAGDHPEALATLGTLALGEDEPVAAAALFDAALARNPDAPRAWVGRGLSRMIDGDKVEAAREIDRGAQLFATHIGSWVAAGWAFLIAGDLASARARFETAISLDDSFGESQGSLAVIELLEGRVEEGRRRTEVAVRLDRKGFAAAFASMLLAAGEGDKEKAQRILELALTTPVDASGRTVAQSLTRLGMHG